MDYVKCANFSKREAGSHAEFECCRCSSVNTNSQCHDDRFRPDTFFNSGVVQSKELQKKSNIFLWRLSLSSLGCFQKNHLEDVNVRRHHLVQLSTSVFEMVSMRKTLRRDRNPQQRNKLDRRLRSICTKLVQGNVEAGIRMAVDDDKIADFTVNNYAALKLKEPQREFCSVPEPTDLDCFLNSEFFVHSVLMSFTSGSSAGLDGTSPQILKRLTATSNGLTGMNFLRALTNLVNVNEILDREVPREIRP